jgi:Periplasmic copper-binding protein (NosD)
MTRISLAILALAIGCCLALSSHEASASHVSCGDTITADTTLDSDLLDCPNNGIVIGADDITLDLNGHMIDGDGEFEPCPVEAPCDAGVLNNGHDGVTVSDGSVRQFADGVFVRDARDSNVVGISSSENDSDGILVVASNEILVDDSSANGNLAHAVGVTVLDSQDVQVLHSSFRDNAQQGLSVYRSPGTLIRGNVSSHNFREGILISGRGIRVRRNRSVRNRDGILVSGSRNVIAGNRISRIRKRQPAPGSPVCCFGALQEGIRIEGRRNRVARNLIVGTRDAGIHLGFQRHRIGARNIVRRNRVRKSGGDGFLVETGQHSLLNHNVASRAGDDGFDIHSRFTKLTGNQAVRNGDLGIEAIAGVTDGGGNRARGNGDSAQCKNVACK